jgi:hypothetical protein
MLLHGNAQDRADRGVGNMACGGIAEMMTAGGLGAGAVLLCKESENWVLKRLQS